MLYVDADRYQQYQPLPRCKELNCHVLYTTLPQSTASSQLDRVSLTELNAGIETPIDIMIEKGVVKPDAWNKVPTVTQLRTVAG